MQRSSTNVTRSAGIACVALLSALVTVGASKAAAAMCAGPYDVTLAVEGSGQLGSLHVAVDYSAAIGAFAGAGEAVACSASSTLGNSLAMFNDFDQEMVLVAGFVSAPGFPASTEIMTCRFDADVDRPQVGQFTAMIEAAAKHHDHLVAAGNRFADALFTRRSGSLFGRAERKERR